MLDARHGLIAVVLALAVGACSAAGGLETSPTLSLTGPVQQEAVRTAAPGSYVLSPGDSIRVKVYNEAELSGSYDVNDAGFISMPLAGDVKAVGLTAAQLQKAIAAKLRAGMVRDPRVNVDVVAYRP